jgi:hypothetical protein
MKTHIIALAAVWGLATPVFAGELDREFKGSDAKVPATAPAAPPSAGLSRTELDDESPTQAGRYHGGWGWGHHHGWGHGWGWGHHHGWGWGRGWGWGVGYGWGGGGWGYGYRSWYRPYNGFYGAWGWPSYYYRPYYSYYYPSYAYAYYPSWSFGVYGSF